jgi:SpoU rRNA methylase family enzyme
MALNIYKKMHNVFNGMYVYPKQELAKINFNLIARYFVISEDDENKAVQGIMKRIVRIF